MVKDISDIVWGFISGAFVLSISLLIGFIRYILKEKDDKMEAQEEKINQILINTSVIPAMQNEIRQNSSDIRQLQLDVVGLKHDSSKDKSA